MCSQTCVTQKCAGLLFSLVGSKSLSTASHAGHIWRHGHRDLHVDMPLDIHITMCMTTCMQADRHVYTHTHAYAGRQARARVVHAGLVVLGGTGLLKPIRFT